MGRELWFTSLSLALWILFFLLYLSLNPYLTITHVPGLLGLYRDSSSSVNKCSGDQRRNFVQQQCQILREKYPKDWRFPRQNVVDMNIQNRSRFIWGVLADEKHKLLFCTSAKVASSSFRYILAVNSDNIRLSDISKNHTPMKLRHLHKNSRLARFNVTGLGKFSDSEILYRLKNYRKVMVVRDPLLRVYSAYREKVSGIKGKCGPYRIRIESAIIKTLRRNFTKGSLCKYAATYPEFMKFIAGPGRYLIRHDRHWRHQFGKCQPCAIDYDYYIRLETGETDMKYFFDEYMHPAENKSQLASGVWLNNHGGRIEDAIVKDNYVKLEEHYKHVDVGDFEKIKNYYHRDSFLFGYTQLLDETGMRSVCRVSYGDNTTQCC